MGGRGGVGGIGGSGGNGGGGAGGAIKISTAVWRLDSVNVDASGGLGADAHSSGGNGRLILSLNSPDPVSVNLEGATLTTVQDGLGHNLGVRAPNPYYAFGNSPLIPELVGGPDAFGFLAQASQEIVVRDCRARGPHGAASALMLLAGPPPGSDFSFPGYATLLFINLHSGTLDHPSLGAGWNWVSPLRQGGPTRKTEFGGSGDSMVDSLLSGQVFATLVSGDTSRINAAFQMGGNDYVAGAENLIRGQIYFFLPDIDNDALPDSWEISHFGRITGVGPDDDPDGDGYSNAAEFRAGTSPLDGTSVLRIALLPPAAGTDWSLVFSAIGGRRYQPQYRDDLSTSSWMNLGTELLAQTNGPLQLAGAQLGGPFVQRRFYRVKVVE